MSLDSLKQHNIVPARNVALALGLKRYFTGIPCIHGHLSERNTKSGVCLACGAKRRRELIRRHPEIAVKSNMRNAEQKKKHAEYMKSRYRSNPGLAREISLKSLYGITQQEYDAMFASQGGVCAICKKEKVGNKNRKPLFVDHHHDSKQVRGLLCHNCNLLLGHAKDNPSILYSAAKYLERYVCESTNTIQDAIVPKENYDFLQAA